jgi:hypothetical protein
MPSSLESFARLLSIFLPSGNENVALARLLFINDSALGEKGVAGISFARIHCNSLYLGEAQYMLVSSPINGQSTCPSLLASLAETVIALGSQTRAAPHGCLGKIRRNILVTV